MYTCMLFSDMFIIVRLFYGKGWGRHLVAQLSALPHFNQDVVCKAWLLPKSIVVPWAPKQLDDLNSFHRRTTIAIVLLSIHSHDQLRVNLTAYSTSLCCRTADFQQEHGYKPCNVYCKTQWRAKGTGEESSSSKETESRSPLYCLIEFESRNIPSPTGPNLRA